MADAAKRRKALALALREAGSFEEVEPDEQPELPYLADPLAAGVSLVFSRRRRGAPPRLPLWPFVRLAVARYQPQSIPGMHLSPIVECDFAQLAPDRIATVSRPGGRQARVVVSGPVGYPRDLPAGRAADGSSPTLRERVEASRTVRARLERRDPEIGTLELPRALPPRRPGSRANWRVTVEELEHLPADPPPGHTGSRTEARLVYADRLHL